MIHTRLTHMKCNLQPHEFEFVSSVPGMVLGASAIDRLREVAIDRPERINETQQLLKRVIRGEQKRMQRSHRTSLEVNLAQVHRMLDSSELPSQIRQAR